jgi:hypothetical protein
MGRANISHFGHGQFPGDIYAPAISAKLSNATSGFWYLLCHQIHRFFLPVLGSIYDICTERSRYSNLHEGDCDSPKATACRWKVIETVVSKNATCVNGRVSQAVLVRSCSVHREP